MPWDERFALGVAEMDATHLATMDAALAARLKVTAGR